ncbi:collagen alpha-1(I) chain-like [Odocoileus virginianus]|uniref:Collagen alpha-1(I) chain-like n=1 Tax=Odocoileus virginianus TaxID=9874 RepID=A0ABM4HVJ3_ODOVR
MGHEPSPSSSPETAGPASSQESTRTGDELRCENSRGHEAAGQPPPRPLPGTAQAFCSGRPDTRQPEVTAGPLWQRPSQRREGGVLSAVGVKDTCPDLEHAALDRDTKHVLSGGSLIWKQTLTTQTLLQVPSNGAPWHRSEASSDLLSGQRAVQRGQEMDKGLRLLSSAAMTSLKQQPEKKLRVPGARGARGSWEHVTGSPRTPGVGNPRPAGRSADGTANTRLGLASGRGGRRPRGRPAGHRPGAQTWPLRPASPRGGRARHWPGSRPVAVTPGHLLPGLPPGPRARDSPRGRAGPARDEDGSRRRPKPRRGMGPGRRLPRPLRWAPGRARREGSTEEETGDDGRAGRSKLRLLRAPGPVQVSNAAAAAASGFMAKTPAPLPLPPPPPPRTEVPVTRRSTPGLRGRSPAPVVRHVPPYPAPARVTWHKHVCPQ